MKHLVLKSISLSLLLFLTVQSFAQDVKYRRSSLTMILLESETFPNKETVMNSWNNYPFPDKYNKHDINQKTVNINNLTLTDEDMLKKGLLKDTLKSELAISLATAGGLRSVKYLNNENTVAVLLPTEKEETQLKIDKYISESKLANRLVAKWFNKSADGKMDMSVIQERGFYNASEMEASIAKGQTRGTSSLGDAGEELIRNTFVTFTRLNFYENEPVARIIRDAAILQTQKSLAGKPQMVIDVAMKGIEKIYEKTKEGYSIWSKTWLYRLNWNDSISTIFYNDLWSKSAEFDKSDLFSLEFVGVQYNQSLVTFKLGETRTQDQIIDLGVVRNVDNAFAKLQKQNDVFKPKVPVLTSGPITAQIGMKEGLSGGEKFDVLELTVSPKTGYSEYKKVGTVKVDKKVIWDNRYNAGGKPEAEQVDKEGKPISATKFSGGKKIMPGMLLKQVK